MDVHQNSEVGRAAEILWSRREMLLEELAALESALAALDPMIPKPKGTRSPAADLHILSQITDRAE